MEAIFLDASAALFEGEWPIQCLSDELQGVTGVRRAGSVCSPLVEDDDGLLWREGILVVFVLVEVLATNCRCCLDGEPRGVDGVDGMAVRGESCTGSTGNTCCAGKVVRFGGCWSSITSSVTSPSSIIEKASGSSWPDF